MLTFLMPTWPHNSPLLHRSRDIPLSWIIASIEKSLSKCYYQMKHGCIVSQPYLPCHATAMPALDFARLSNNPGGWSRVAVGKRLTYLDFPVNHTVISILICKDAFNFSRVKLRYALNASLVYIHSLLTGYSKICT